jgi:SAM-dependent methyltransferase
VPHPESVVANLVRAARPGGRIVLADDDHENFRPWPEPAGFATLWKAYVKSYLAAGNDPFVGRRLVGLLRSAGAVDTRIASIFFGGCKGDRRFDAVAENLVRMRSPTRSGVAPSCPRCRRKVRSSRRAAASRPG